MTKRELLNALADVDDDTVVLVETEYDGDLIEVVHAAKFDRDGPYGPPFVVLITQWLGK